MRKHRITILILLLFIVGIGYWYFGYFKSTPKNLESNKVFVIRSPKKSVVPQNEQDSHIDSTQNEVNKVKDDKAENKNNAINKTIKREVNTEHNDSTSEKLQPKNEPSPEEIKAFDAYFLAETEYIAKKEAFKKALISGNDEQLNTATDSLRTARLHRNKTLENLTAYSDEAVKIMENILATDKMAESIMGEISKGNTEFDTELLKQLDEYPFLRDVLKKHGFLTQD